MRTFDIVFVPGVRPKPPAAEYRRELLRCIDSGLQRCAPAAARALEAAPEAFHLFSWTGGIYGEHRDIELDRPGIDALLAAPGLSAAQRAEIDSPMRDIARIAHRVGDRFPAFGRLLASERQRVVLREARAYLRDHENVASLIRADFRALLDMIYSRQRRLVIIGHSLGSVIAYDTLWELSGHSPVHVELFLTIGSPLGTRFVRSLLKGVDEPVERRYPRNISHWRNISAKGELTALYPRLGTAFSEMLELGFLESLEDCIDVQNYFTGPQGMNVHSEYAYVIQPEFATALAGVVLPDSSD